MSSHEEIFGKRTESGEVIMTREQARAIVNEQTYRVGSCKAVSLDACLVLLGSTKFSMMHGDAIRNKGPEAEAVYPWNIVDYLCNDDPRAKKGKGLAK